MRGGVHPTNGRGPEVGEGVHCLAEAVPAPALRHWNHPPQAPSEEEGEANPTIQFTPPLLRVSKEWSGHWWGEAQCYFRLCLGL